MNNTNTFAKSGQIVDIINKKIFPGTVFVKEGKVSFVVESEAAEKFFIIPGFIDAHIHIESSLLMPSRFAAAVLQLQWLPHRE